MGQGIFFYLGYSFKSLINNGQRAVLAIFCVAFGVMSLVAMQNMAESVTTVVLGDPAFRLGGQTELNRDTNLSPANIAEIARLKTDGKITAYNPAAEEYGLKLKRPGSASMAYIDKAIGVDPTIYPIVGQLRLGQGSPTSLAQAIATPGTVAVTRDIADDQGLKIGDTLVVCNDTDIAPFSLKVGGIVIATPDSAGNKIYYSLETARQLANRQDAVNYIQVNWAPGVDSAAIQAQLQNSGWRTYNASEQSADAKKGMDLFNFMLKGAGILGLLVGGIGVANTMVVLLANRQKEIAILKTLGYRRWHLFVLLGLEVGLLGLVGSLLGVALAYFVSGGLIYLFSQTGSILLETSFDFGLGLLGILIGIVTTLIFGMFAIVRASEVRPMQLLRNLPVKIRWFQTTLLALALAVPFTLVTTFVLGSIEQGIGILLIALGGLVVLGSVLGLAMWLIIKALPTFRFYFLAMARKNLARRWLVNLFAMIALFTGVLTAGFAGVVIQGAQGQVDARSPALTGYNLSVYGLASQETTLKAAFAGQGITTTQARYTALVKSVEQTTPPANNDQTFYFGNVLNGRETPWDVTLDGAAWGSDPSGVYLPDYGRDLRGTQLTITSQSGATRTVTVVGTYALKNIGSPLLSENSGLLTSKDLVTQLGGPQTRLLVAGEVGLDRLTETSTKIGQSMQDVMVVTSLDYNNYRTGRVRNFFIFAVAMAGLAILAGLVLVANTVGLAMIYRQREMGVLKAVGYTRWHVLKGLLLEYGIMALVASIGALIGVQVAVIAFSKLEASTDGILSLNLPTAVASVILALLVTLVTATMAAWQALQVRPSTLLRQET